MDNYTLATPKIILRLFFWIFLYLLFRHFISQNTFELSKTYWSLMLLLTLTPLGIVISTILLQPEWAFDTKAVFLSSVVLLFLSLFSLIGLLITVSVLASHEKLQEEKHLLDLNVNYYKNMEQQQFEIRRLRHDMANHLQTLSTLPPDKMKEYINSLLADNAFTTTVVYCKDDIVNAVLNSKVSTMENEAISFSHELLISKALPYRPADLCALFANALDNAIEACCKLPADQRKIILAAKADKGLLAVQIENPLPPDCIGITDSGDRPFKKEGSFFKSTKKDASSHGYGLRSINEIVTRLQGSMEITEKDGMFCLFLYLPL